MATILEDIFVPPFCHEDDKNVLEMYTYRRAALSFTFVLFSFIICTFVFVLSFASNHPCQKN